MLAAITFTDIGELLVAAGIVGGFIVWVGRQLGQKLEAHSLRVNDRLESIDHRIDDHMTREEASADALERRLTGLNRKIDDVATDSSATRENVAFIAGGLGVTLPRGGS